MTDLFDPLPASSATRRKENTRARLVRASLDVFVEKGIDGATVDDLVSAAGFTRGAFYSNFSTREEVFAALFVSVTDELLTMIDRVGEDVVPSGDPDGCAGPRAEDAAALVAAFEAIRPFGRQWYLLYSDAVARSLRDEELKAGLRAQLARLRERIGALLSRGMERNQERSLLPLEDLSQLVVGLYIDLMVREQLDGRDVTELAATTILGTLHAFIGPRGEDAGSATGRSGDTPGT